MNAIQRTFVILAAVLPVAVSAETIFTYQGKLGTSGQPAEGSHDFVFRLFDAETSGIQIGSDLVQSGIDVSGGVFTVQLDFGDTPFNSSPRWLEIDVRQAGAGVYTTLSPRQRVGASPFAIETMFVAPGSVDTAALQDNSVTTNKIANGSVFTDDLANFAVATNKLSNQAVTRLKLAEDSVGSAQIENNSVTSADIRDGTITAVDVSGGFLLAERSQVYLSVGTASTVSGNTSLNVTAQCSDANDIPLTAFCSVDTNAHLTVVREFLPEDWESATLPAGVRCAFQNTHPDLGANVRAIISCIEVP